LLNGFKKDINIFFTLTRKMHLILGIYAEKPLQIAIWL